MLNILIIYYAGTLNLGCTEGAPSPQPFPLPLAPAPPNISDRKMAFLNFHLTTLIIKIIAQN